MDCFSRYCFNKPKQPKRTSNSPLNNTSLPNATNNYLLSHTNNLSRPYNGELEEKIFDNMKGFSSEGQSTANQEIDEKIIGWAEEKNENQKKLDKLGETVYIIQIGKFNPEEKRTSANPSLNQWAVSDAYHQFSKQPRNSSIPSIVNSKLTQNKFPDPLIRYKFIPSIDQTMAIDVTTQNNQQKKLTRGNLIVWNYHGGPNQHFYIRQSRHPDAYYIVSVATGFVVTAQNEKDRYRKEITPIIVNPHQDRNEQLWRITSEQCSTYLIQAYGDSSMVLDLYKQRASNDTPVVLCEKTGEKNQRWIILSG